MKIGMPESALYGRIYVEIEGRILSGEWPPGYRVPSEKEMCQHYGCSRMTVSKALGLLSRQGYIERRRGAGTFVTRPHAQSAVLEIHDIRAEVESLGREYGYTLLDRREREAIAGDAHHFEEVEPGLLLELTAVHFAGRQPFCFEERTINLVAVPEASAESFTATAPGAWLLSRVPWNMAEHEISARGATPASAAALTISAGTPCLVIERRTWNANHVVTFVRLTYTGESHSLVARFAPTGND